MPSRVVVGIIISASLMIISIYYFTVDNVSSTKAWSYLLLTPLPLAISFSPKIVLKNIIKEKNYWEDESEEMSVGEKNPIELGFDIPIL